MRKKFLITVMLAACIIVCGVTLPPRFVADASAAAEIAMELSTKTVLSESNADKRMPMASTTKIMTALLIAEDCDLDEEITVPNEAVGVEGSSIYLKKDEKIDIRDLLYGLMLRSGNDAATALAIHHSGGVEEFAKAMNERAKEIGAENTNFKNPSGLPDDEHYTTARDLCKIACCAMENDVFSEVVSTKNYSGKYRSYANKNKMLYSYEGANGVKTGYTLKAGRCLVSSAKRNGMDVVTVVLNCPDMYARSAQLLDYAFLNFKLLNLTADDVFIADGIACSLDKNVTEVVNCANGTPYEITLVKRDGRVRKGDLVAELKIFCANGLQLSENLYSIIDR